MLTWPDACFGVFAVGCLFVLMLLWGASREGR